MRKYELILRQAPEGQSAAADGQAAADQSAPQGGDPNANVSTDAPPANVADTSEKAPETSDEQAPAPQTEPQPAQEAAPEDDPIKPLADALESLASTVGEILPVVTDLARRVAALEDKPAGDAADVEKLLAEQAQKLLRSAMQSLAAEFSDLPAKVKALEGRLKHF